jgi:4-diphosphocytidyl-2-C-methyl-D-erythritol kinase
MIKKLSPAKVNLYLEVLGKRSDGYHDIKTLMQRISLCDEMFFAPVDHGITIHCPDSSLPEDENNIVFRAARTFLSDACTQMGIQVTIKKNIPLAAGLGGGSSNAATTLMALNEILHFPYTTSQLMKMASTLGADVPFFIFEKTAWGTGIGDQLTAVEDFPPLCFVIINPSFEISTKMVYDNFNFRLTKEPIEYKSFDLSSIEDVARGLYNDLETVSIHFYPVLQQLKDLLLMEGASGALMSGSGPTVFGIFTEEEKALKAEESLRKLGTGKWSVFKAYSI